MSVLVICPQGKYPYLPSNIRICPHISVVAPVFNFRYLRSGLKDYMSNLPGKIMHKDMQLTFSYYWTCKNEHIATKYVIIRDYYMTFSILALVLARDSHIKPDSEAEGLIWVEG
jgi:hypothetical protein